MKNERTQPALQDSLDERETVFSYLSSIVSGFIAKTSARSVPFDQIKD